MALLISEGGVGAPQLRVSLLANSPLLATDADRLPVPQAALRTEYKLALCFTPVLLHALYGDAATQQELFDAVQAINKQFSERQADGSADGGAASAAPAPFKIKESPELKRRLGDVVQDLVDWGWV